MKKLIILFVFLKLFLSCETISSSPNSNTLLDNDFPKRVFGMNHFYGQYNTSVPNNEPGKKRDVISVSNDVLTLKGYAFGNFYKRYRGFFETENYVQFNLYDSIFIEINYEFENNMDSTLFFPNYMTQYYQRLTSEFTYIYYEYEKIGSDSIYELKYSKLNSLLASLVNETTPIKLKIRFAFDTGQFENPRISPLIPYVPNDAVLKFKSTIYGYYK